jgi:hypothetical protein
MPLLTSSNCFAVLSVEEVYKLDAISLIYAIVNDPKAVPTPSSPHS